MFAYCAVTDRSSQHYLVKGAWEAELPLRGLYHIGGMSDIATHGQELGSPAPPLSVTRYPTAQLRETLILVRIEGFDPGSGAQTGCGLLLRYNRPSPLVY